MVVKTGWNKKCLRRFSSHPDLECVCEVSHQVKLGWGEVVGKSVFHHDHLEIGV